MWFGMSKGMLCVVWDDQGHVVCGWGYAMSCCLWLRISKGMLCVVGDRQGHAECGRDKQEHAACKIHWCNDCLLTTFIFFSVDSTSMELVMYIWLPSIANCTTG